MVILSSLIPFLETFLVQFLAGLAIGFIVTDTIYPKLPRPKSPLYYYCNVYMMYGLGIALIFIIYDLIQFAEIHALVDLSLLVTLVIAEVPIAVFLHYILGERGRSQEQKTNDAIQKLRAISQFAHLETCYVDDGNLRYEYPLARYFIVNKHTSLAFWVNEEIRTLRDNHIISERKFKCETELDDYLAKHNPPITKVPRKPLATELDP